MLDALKAKLSGKQNGAGEKPKRGKVSAGSGSVSGYFVSVLLLLLLLGGASAALVMQMQSTQANQQSEAQLKTVSGLVATRLSAEVAEAHRRLKAYLASQPLAGQFLNEDLEGLKQHELQLKQLYPEFVSARLLPLEWNETSDGKDSLLGFASLDLLRRVERSGQASPLEVHRFGSPQQHVALALPVIAPQGGKVVGLLHAGLPGDWLQRALAGLQVVPGRIEIQQLDSGRSLVLASVGGAAPNLKVAAPVAGTIWQVAYAVAPPVGDQLLLPGLLLLLVVLAGGVLLLQGWRLKTALRKDVAGVCGLVEQLGQGVSPAAMQAQVGELQPLVDQLRTAQLSARVTARKPGTAKTADADASILVPEVGLMDDETFDAAPATQGGAVLSSEIFRAYDIRGIYGDSLTEQVVFDLGRAIGSQVYDQGQQGVVVARDGRESSSALSKALCKGLAASGRDVIDIGMVPTPVLYFATHQLGANSGVMVTGSHNPPEYNGLKIVIDGKALAGDEISALKSRIEAGQLLQGSGSCSQQDVLADYIQRVIGDVQLSRPMKVVVDCGSGVAGVVAPALLQALGCEVVPLFCHVDGSFPGHHPDPSKPENLRHLVAAVKDKQADIGIAFDGDGDRLGVVDGGGKIIWPDRLLMLLARDVLARQPGSDVIYDVKCTRNLSSQILAAGGRPIMWKTGHSLIKAKMKETGALLAGEMSGHIYIKERWYGFDDGLYSCARLLEVLSMEGGSPTEVFATLPESVSTSELTLALKQEGRNFELMDKLRANANFPGAKVIDIDGLRVEFGDGWGLVRASNTTPALVFRFEADSDKALAHIQGLFRQTLSTLDPDLAQLPF